MMVEESRFKRSEHKLLERYLLRSGWKRQTYPNHIRRIYLDGDESGGEIELFFTDDARSADREIKLALNTLSQLCERSIASIIYDVRSLAYDIIRTRVPTEYVRNEAIELRLAATYIKNMKDFLASAATTEVTGGKSYKRVLKDAVSYSEGCLFGHTFKGSFGFVIESPLGLNESPALDIVEETPPFERKVVERIANGLISYRKAVEEQSPAPIVAHGQGFSANMCDILAGIVEEMEVSRLDINIALSPEWRSISSEDISSIFSIEFKDLGLLREASKSLRQEEEEPQEVTIFGRVKRLETEGNPADLFDRTAAREIEVNWVNEDDKLLRVKCAVSPSNYLLAVEAHKSGKIVSATGMLAKTGRSWVLNDVSEFKVHDL